MKDIEFDKCFFQGLWISAVHVIVDVFREPPWWSPKGAAAWWRLLWLFALGIAVGFAVMVLFELGAICIRKLKGNRNKRNE